MRFLDPERIIRNSAVQINESVLFSQITWVQNPSGFCHDIRICSQMSDRHSGKLNGFGIFEERTYNVLKTLSSWQLLRYSRARLMWSIFRRTLQYKSQGQRGITLFPDFFYWSVIWDWRENWSNYLYATIHHGFIMWLSLFFLRIS